MAYRRMSLRRRIVSLANRRYYCKDYSRRSGSTLLLDLPKGKERFMRGQLTNVVFTLCVLIALLTTPLATPAYGQVTLFTDRQSFNAAVPNLTNIDFAAALPRSKSVV